MTACAGCSAAGDPGSPGQPQAGATADAVDRAGGGLSAAKHEQAGGCAQTLSLCSAGSRSNGFNRVWCSDITPAFAGQALYPDIPMAKGFLYLVAIIDWHRRAVLGRRLSNTLGTEFCVEVLQEALARHGRPEIFNTDQSLPQRRLGAASSPAPNSPSCSSVAGYDHHGWQRPLHGQRLHRAMVAQPEV
jgi:transposase InsO family protein